MKKEIVFLLVFAILIGFLPLRVQADKDYDKALEAAIIRSKKLFNIGNDYDIFKQRISANGDKAIFYLSWSDKKEELGSIDLSIDGNGNILSYSSWSPREEKNIKKDKRISREEGLQISKDFIKKVSPDFYENISYEENQKPININSDSYNYNFIRMENNIPYYNNNIQVSVNTFTAKLEGYYTNWETDLTFTSKPAKIDLAGSEEIFKDRIGLDLVYRSNDIHKSGSNAEEAKFYLVYIPSNTSLSIDAFTGDLVESNNYRMVYSMMDGGLKAEEKESMTLSPEERQAVGEVSGLISKSEAEKTSREILELDSDFLLESSGVYKNYRSDQYNWNLSFKKENKDKDYSYSNIVINAKTKELVSFWRDTNLGETTDKISRDKALDLARKSLDKFNPNKAREVELKEEPMGLNPLDGEERDDYSFTFTRKLGKAYVESDSITISFYGGRLNSYNVNWSKGSFDSQDRIIGLEKAYQTLFDQVAMELKYIAPKDKDKDKAAQLVYGLKSHKAVNISAKDASILTYDGKTYREDIIIEYEDIEDSPAKDQIKTLLEYGIGLPGSQFKPQTKIREKDFLSLLLKSMDFYYEIDGDNDKLYKRLEELDMVKRGEKYPNSLISRENSIKFIIRALGYDKLASLDTIYRDIFKDSKDINPRLKGHVAMAYGLAIVDEGDGYFYPNSQPTREEAMELIYKYLFMD